MPNKRAYYKIVVQNSQFLLRKIDDTIIPTMLNILLAAIPTWLGQQHIKARVPENDIQHCMIGNMHQCSSIVNLS